MEFTLVYRGPLKSNGNATEKHTIRRSYHTQLKKLWTQVPLNDFGFYLSDPPQKDYISIIEHVEKYNFAPLVTSKLHLIAEIKITLLKPEEPGGIVTQGGDIDNRLKTLLDSLRMPKNAGEIPSGESPSADENPFYCLLEDDNLITKVAVDTDRLLEPATSSSEVQLFIHVTTKVTRLTFNNMGLG